MKVQQKLVDHSTTIGPLDTVNDSLVEQLDRRCAVLQQELQVHISELYVLNVVY